MYQEEGDEREGQILRDFDTLFYELLEAIDKFELPAPPLFQRPVNHTCLTHFNNIATPVEDDEELRKISASNLVKKLAGLKKLALLSKKKFRGEEGAFLFHHSLYPLYISMS